MKEYVYQARELLFPDFMLWMGLLTLGAMVS